MAEKRPALGKGLSALIPDAINDPVLQTAATEVEIALLSPNTLQPRRDMDPAGLEDLAQSIRAQGVIQPILVRPVDGRYQIIAGERRWRAAQRAGLLRVPVVIRDVPGGHEQTLLLLALMENIQREDLNPIDAALGYRSLIEQFHLTQEDVALAMGKDRSSIANALRLLKLPEDVRAQVAKGRLSMGHARAMLTLVDPNAIRKLADEAVARDYSVRQVEAAVKRLAAAPATPPEKRSDVHTRVAEEQMRLSLGTHVQIVRRGKGGSVRIAFKSEDDLQRIYERITGK